MIAIDNDERANTTKGHCKDILEVESTELDFVADFMWVSPPCHTYSRAAGAYHRSLKDGEYAKTPEAHLHDNIFFKMVQLMKDAKKKHPHLIVVIENPVGLLAKMPAMVCPHTYGIISCLFIVCSQHALCFS